MRINQIISEKRKEKKLTQEELAEYLCITAPAVNKWEKGHSYPDITLIPALSRALGIDPNTLLSFNEDLSDSEIGDFMMELNLVLEEKGYDEAFKHALKKISDFPSCDLLINSVATFLMASSSMAEDETKDGYERTVKSLFNRVKKSKNSVLQSQAKVMSIAKYIDKGEYSKAEKMIESMPDITLSKEYLLGELNVKKNEHEKALELFETKILLNASEIQSLLLRIIQITKTDEIKKYAHIYDKFGDLFELNYNMISLAKLEVGIYEKDKDSCLQMLQNMVSSGINLKEMNTSCLYKHVTNNTFKGNTKLYQKSILEGIMKRDDTDFLKEDETFIHLYNDN